MEKPLDTAGVEQRIRDFVLTKVEARGITHMDNTGSLVAAGVVDSLGVFQFVAFLEEKFDIRVRDDEIGLDNFETIERAARFVIRKHQGSSARA